MSSLTQGGEPLASEEEYHDWMHQWFTTHPGRSVEEPDAPGGRRWEDGPYPPLAAMPWPIQRRWALTTLTCFSWDFVLRYWRVRREIEEADGKRRGSANSMFSAPTEADLRKVWAQSRRETIRQFRLEGLVSELDEGPQRAVHDPPS